MLAVATHAGLLVFTSTQLHALLPLRAFGLVIREDDKFTLLGLSSFVGPPLSTLFFALAIACDRKLRARFGLRMLWLNGEACFEARGGGRQQDDAVQSLRVAELRELLAERGIDGSSVVGREQLERALMEANGGGPPMDSTATGWALIEAGRGGEPEQPAPAAEPAPAPSSRPSNVHFGIEGLDAVTALDSSVNSEVIADTEDMLGESQQEMSAMDESVESANGVDGELDESLESAGPEVSYGEHQTNHVHAGGAEKHSQDVDEYDNYSSDQFEPSQNTSLDASGVLSGEERGAQRAFSTALAWPCAYSRHQIPTTRRHPAQSTPSWTAGRHARQSLP